MLRQAHRMVEMGDFIPAARLFETLAEGALQRGLPQYPLLLLQSARARIQGGEINAGLAALHTAFESLVHAGRLGSARNLAPGTRQFLDAQGLADAWQPIEELLDGAGSAPVGTAPTAPIRLPAKCPYCGGTLHPAEVERTPDGGAVCPYCGSVVEGAA